MLFVVSPFVTCTFPYPTVNNLKAILKKTNITSEICYANIQMKCKMNFSFYEELSDFFKFPDLAESVFASYAFPKEIKKHQEFENNFKKNNVELFNKIQKVKDLAGSILAGIKDYITEKSPKIIWFDIYQNQLTSSIAIINLIKTYLPNTIITMGGLKCLSPMGDELLNATTNIDYIFSGEPEIKFPEFCREILNNKNLQTLESKKKIIHCDPINDISELPYPDFSDYIQQLKSITTYKKISFEGSRGCWWGEKSHCIFCGYNGKKNLFRKKVPERVHAELDFLIDEYKPDVIHALDSNLPLDYPKKVFKNLKIGKKLKYFFYELSPQLKFHQLSILKDKSFNICQAGIETFDDDLLKILNKGTTALNNIRFLKDCRKLNIDIRWNFLYEIPGERDEMYYSMLELMPKIEHLQAPHDIRPLFITRFTPLHNDINAYKISNLKPYGGYQYFFPDIVNINNLAKYFTGKSFLTIQNRLLRNKFLSVANSWKIQWEKKKKPKLELINKNGHKFLIDTRQHKNSNLQLCKIGYNIIKLFQKPIPEARIPEYISNKTHFQIFQNFIAKDFIVKVGNNYLSIVLTHDNKTG